MNSVTSNIQSLADKADVVRERAAESLESAAAAIGDLANDAGRKLNSTAAFVRPCADGEKLSGLRNSVRRNPMGSLAIAAAFGVVAGFACRRSV